MIVSLRKEADRQEVVRELAARGIAVASVEEDREGGVLLVASPCSVVPSAADIERIPGVRSVALAKSPHPRVSAQGPTVDVAGVRIGGASPVLMAGPCSVESEEQVRACAAALAPLGARFLRGGAFKPRTSPYAFQGVGHPGLRWLREAADAHGMRVVTEVLSENDVPAVAEAADLLQIGSRNMQNFALLRAAGSAGKPVLLKRSMSATVEEWLLAGEYLLAHGASGVVFCERGIRGFDASMRNLLDLSAVALLAHVHRLPVIVDPSHATGRRARVAPKARAGRAAGAAGLMIETHPAPGEARSDGPQAIPLSGMAELVASLRHPFAAPAIVRTEPERRAGGRA
jgi:3-deoxy-7-phosphoheptulonate synthase